MFSNYFSNNYFGFTLCQLTLKFLILSVKSLEILFPVARPHILLRWKQLSLPVLLHRVMLWEPIKLCIASLKHIELHIKRKPIICKYSGSGHLFLGWIMYACSLRVSTFTSFSLYLTLYLYTIHVYSACQNSGALFDWSCSRYLRPYHIALESYDWVFFAWRTAYDNFFFLFIKLWQVFHRV